jgi:hypothetical protein
MPRVLTDLEAIELESANGARDLLSRFADARNAHVPRLAAAGAAITERAKKFVPQSYIQAFCDANRTGVTVRPHAVYEPFDGNAPAPVGAGLQSSPSMPAGMNAGGSIGSAGSGTLSALGGGGGGPPPTVAPRAGAGGAAAAPERCRALYDYEAQDDGEISFKGGDIMLVLHKDESGWWQCQNRGQTGLAPSNFCELLPAAAPAGAAVAAAVSAAPQAGYVQNQAGYASQAGAGAVSSPSAGYAQNQSAAYASQAGPGAMAPTQSNYATQAPPYGGVAGPAGAGRGPAPIMGRGGGGGGAPGGRGPPPGVGGRPSAAPPVMPAFAPVNPNDPAVGRRVRALYDYSADGDDELSMSAGDEFTVVDNDGGWYVVFAQSIAAFRKIPSNFCSEPS